MDPKELIASGKLESYVLGLCTVAEAAAIEQVMAASSDVREEVEAIRTSLETYAQTVARKPPDELRNRILDAIADEPRQAGMQNSGMTETPVIPFRQAQTVNTNRWALVAASVLILISLSANFWLYRNWQGAESQLASVQAENDVLASSVQTTSNNLAMLQDQLALMNDPKAKLVQLLGTANHPEMHATVIWNTGSGKVYLNTAGLPQSQPGSQYQLWAIVDGKPVNAGLVQENQTGLQPMLEFTAAQAFAVTIEPQGGSATPTLEAMVVIGNS